jgi:hypothetical protein
MWSRELAKYDNPRDKIQHLKNMLTDVGMTGQYSQAKAKQIKERRELEDEVAAVNAGDALWGEGDDDNEKVTTRSGKIAAATSNTGGRRLVCYSPLHSCPQKLISSKNRCRDRVVWRASTFWETRAMEIPTNHHHSVANLSFLGVLFFLYNTTIACLLLLGSLCSWCLLGFLGYQNNGSRIRKAGSSVYLFWFISTAAVYAVQ